MSVTAASGFVVLLSVAVVQAQNGWSVTYGSTSICAPEGSTVEMSCSYTHPYTHTVQTRFWYQEKNQYVDLSTVSEYRGRVEYFTGQNVCTMRIKNLRKDDSATYIFRFLTNQAGGVWSGSPGVTLTVTALQVEVSRSATTDKKASLRCHSECAPAVPRVWFRNGQRIHDGIAYEGRIDAGDELSCALEGFEDYRSALVLVQAQDGWSVTYGSTSICAPEGSTVEMSCIYTHPSTVTKVKQRFWYAEQNMDLMKVSEYRGRVVYSFGENVCILRIKNVTKDDSAMYIFRFKTNQPGEVWWSGSPGVTLTVTALQVEVSRSATTDKKASLRCHSECDPAVPRVWFRNGQRIQNGIDYEGRIDGRDELSCALEGFEGYRSASVYGPKRLSVSVSPSGDIVEGRSVTLTCSSDANPAATYTWYKKNKKLLQGPESKYKFSSIRSDDNGSYECRAENQFGAKSKSVSIDVQYGPKLPSVSVSPSGDIVEGRSVTLTCSSDANPAATYTWYKKNQKLLQGPESKYKFSSIRSDDNGSYECRAENQFGVHKSKSVSIDVQYGPKLPSVSVSPSGDIVEGRSVTLTCSSDANPAATYTWYKKNQKLLQGPESKYKFSSIRSDDNGSYECRAENQFGVHKSKSVSIDVQYAPKLPSVSVSPSGDIMEGSSVTLNCSSDANPAAAYTWYKKNEAAPKASGHMLTVTEVRPEHSEAYYCEARNTIGLQNATVRLNVVSGSKQHVIKIAISLTAGFLVAALLLLVFCIWKKRQSEGGKGPDNNSQLAEDPFYENTSAAAQSSPAEQQADVFYASVRFNRTQVDALYSNATAAQPHPHRGDEDTIEYSTINFSRGTREEAVEDPAQLYSTVTKTHKK